MNPDSAINRLREVIRLKHLSLSTESIYVGWVVRYMDAILKLPPGITSEQKVEAFLTSLAKTDCSASTQNQAFNAILFLYRAREHQHHDGLPHGHAMQRGVPAGVYRIFVLACSRSGSNSRLKYSAACSGVIRSNRAKSRASFAR
jgi:hypothetical protein